MTVDHSVKQYTDNQIFACPYWKSQGISCGLESGHPVHRSVVMSLENVEEFHSACRVC